MSISDPLEVAAQLAGSPDPFILAQSCAAPLEANSWLSAARSQHWAGTKFPGGWGTTHINFPNYWELRARSAQLFTENLYARGLIRRLVTNEINIGLMLDAEPSTALLDSLSEEQASEWTEDVENRLEIWADNPALCDFKHRRTFAELQQEARQEALVEGDILVVLREDPLTKVPQVELIRGARVVSPLGKDPGPGAVKTVHGVDLSKEGRHVGFWVSTPGEEVTRIPAFGEKSKKRLAWLLYGTDRRTDETRGTPLLGLVLQSIREMDRGRDSEQRAATVNSMLAMFITKGKAVAGTKPNRGGAVRNTTASVPTVDGGTRDFNLSSQIPGVVYDELAEGEEPVSFDSKRPNVNYADFEAAIIYAIAWANEIPPEILTLTFNKSHSASKAAIQEFRAYLMKVRAAFGGGFCQHIYVEWLIGEVLAGRIDAPGLLESWADPRQFVTFGAWTRATWGGPVKPSIELAKDIKAYGEAIELNLITHDRASKDLFGVRFSRVLDMLTKERKAIREADGQAPEVAPVPEEGLTPPQARAVLQIVGEEIEEASNA